MAKDRRLTQKQIERLLANNPHKNIIEVAFDAEQPKVDPVTISFTGTDKNFDTMNTVESLKDFIEFIRNTVSRYQENVRLQEEAEQQENDIRHCIELAPKLTEKEKRYLYNKLTDVLQARRACKSENEILQPLYNYFNDNILLNKLVQIQGTVASVKDIVSNRTYSCRTSILNEFRTKANE